MKNKKLNKTILYVEDDLNAQEELLFFLESVVENVLVANNGKEGLELFNSNSCDLIITDIQMPVMSGLEMIKEIRQVSNDIPIIILTAFNESKYLLDALNSGVSSYLFKPLNLKELKKNIDENLCASEDMLFHMKIKDGIILEVSDNWLKNFDYLKEEVINKPFENFLDESYISRFTNDYNEFNLSNDFSNIHFQLKTKTGIRKEMIIDGNINFDSFGKYDSSSCVLKSIKYFVSSNENIIKLLDEERYIKELIKVQASIGKSVSKYNDLNVFLTNVCNDFTDLLKYKTSFIALIGEENKSAEIIAHSDKKEVDCIEILGQNFTLDTGQACVIVQVLGSANIAVANDIRPMHGLYKKDEFTSRGVVSIAGIPIYLNNDDKVYAVLVLMRPEAHISTKEELELFHNISDTIALGIQTITSRIEKEILLKELHLKATTDFLTGANNRQEGINLLNKEINRSKRYDSSLSLLFLDIDNFKHINDNYGHNVGDKVLIDVAKTIKENIRLSDSLIRWGGEEFLVLLVETHIDDAIELTKKIQNSLKQINIEDIKITGSFGISEFISNDDWSSLVSRTDALMYKAKQAGRDRYIVG